MYAIQTVPHEPAAFSLRSDLRAIGRFESWLRSRGLEPDRDPFMPSPSEGELIDRAASVQLVREYLEDRPGERSHWRALLRHMLESQMSAPIWGDTGCGFRMAD